MQQQWKAALYQEKQIKRLQETMEQLVTAPVMARYVQPRDATETISTRSGNLTLGYMEMEAEREQALAALMTSKRFNLLTFDGETVDPRIVETWIDSMETLFENLYTLKRDKVHIAAHYIEKSIRVWWKGQMRPIS